MTIDPKEIARHFARVLEHRTGANIDEVKDDLIEMLQEEIMSVYLSGFQDAQEKKVS